ncbi:secretoglobin family 3A member 1 [Microcebus murinus]|uniref:Secretoglobin family 3A member 1 n=1 Tax=Microcebus murinus TaxID=30608 RepID=A0A8C5ULE8_MICMU|nr:secretoglobin family 3A member 1 [Microcebus murinus]
MKLTTTFLVLCVALLSHSAAAFFMDSVAEPVAQPVAALNSATGAMANPLLTHFNLLKFMLSSLGIPVEHLIEGSQKCVAELGPEAVGAVKTLLGALTMFG